MRFWWVNQNQTCRQRGAGRLPLVAEAQGERPDAYYDFMREVAPGDVVFSFADTEIKAIGIVASHAYEAPKPMEFGQAGAYWEKIGWRVDVTFVELRGPIRPGAHMDRLAPLLPAKYSPLQSNGRGLQSVYLAFLPGPLAGAIIDLIGREAHRATIGERPHSAADPVFGQDDVPLAANTLAACAADPVFGQDGHWHAHRSLDLSKPLLIMRTCAAASQRAPPPGAGDSRARAPVWRNDVTMLACRRPFRSGWLLPCYCTAAWTVVE